MTEQVEKKEEDWMSAKWRPFAAWVYMLICMCDFVIFPVLWSLYHAILHTGQFAQWQPLTLQGAGMLHLAFGAIIGVAAFGRTQEKLAGANNGGLQSPSFGTSTPASPAPSFGSSSVSTPAPSFGASAPAAPASSFGGKPAGPGRAAMPEL